MKNKITLTIGIPAHNEEANIQSMLESVLKQKGDSFVLEKILVVLDGCTDNTLKIVRSMVKNDSRIKILNDGKRTGKATRLNQIYRLNKSDLIGTFDADIILERDCELEIMVKEFVRSKKVLVVAGRQIPLRAENLMGRFGNASFNMLQSASMKWRNGNNIHSLQGSTSILRGKFAKSFKYPPRTVCDQGYLYVTALKYGRESFVFAKNTRIIFRSVSTFSDWRKLGARTMIYDKENLSMYFGKEILNEYKIPKEFIRRAVLYALLKDPIGAIGSILMNLYIRMIPYTFKEKKAQFMGDYKIFQGINKNMKNNYSLTVGIPTYYGGPGLVKAAKSILTSKNVGKFRFIVCVDGNPLGKEIEKQLKDLGVEVVFSKIRGGQVARIKQMISMTESHILVLTQDDIKFDPYALSKIIKAFEDNPGVTMIGARVLPVPAKTSFEKIIEVGVNLMHHIGVLWKGGDNYLLASGRCLAFRTGFIKKFHIPEEVINSDAYLYLENKRKRGIFKHLSDAVVYNKSPQNIKEHLKQSRKFQYSLEELSKRISFDLEKEYSVPAVVKLRAYFEELIKNPFWTLMYFFVFFYTRTQEKNMYSKAKRFWSTDISTKKI